MSECKNFMNMSERILNGECSLEEETRFYDHLSECPSCKEEFEFSSGIQNTLRSLPKIQVHDDFLMSLNEKLDLEDKIKLEMPIIKRKKFYGAWKKYSALTACLLLAVILNMDVLDVNNVSKTDNNIIGIGKTVEVSQNTPSQDTVIPEENTEETVEINVSEEVVEQVPVTIQEEKTVQKEKNLNKNSSEKASKEQKNVNKIKENKVSELSFDYVKENSKNIYTGVSHNTVSAKPQESQQSIKEDNVKNNEEPKKKVLVIKASTPHSNVELPKNEDADVVMVDNVIPKKVRFEDFKMVESEALLDTFAMSEVSDKNVIVATPKAMDAVQNLSIDTNNISGEVPAVNKGAGSGSFYVASEDRQEVASIIRKYSAGEDNEAFMMSSRNYNSFVNELDRQGIEYTDYMIGTEKSNVAFRLMES